jgi:hypothetical protein
MKKIEEKIKWSKLKPLLINNGYRHAEDQEGIFDAFCFVMKTDINDDFLYIEFNEEEVEKIAKEDESDSKFDDLVIRYIYKEVKEPLFDNTHNHYLDNLDFFKSKSPFLLSVRDKLKKLLDNTDTVIRASEYIFNKANVMSSEECYDFQEIILYDGIYVNSKNFIIHNSEIEILYSTTISIVWCDNLNKRYERDSLENVSEEQLFDKINELLNKWEKLGN